MHILAFGVIDFADFAEFHSPPHLKGVVHITVVFGIGVNLAALFDRFNECHRLRHGFAGEHLAEHMPAGVEQANSERGVFIGVVGKYDGVHIVAEKVFKIFINSHFNTGFAGEFFHLIEQRAVFIADGHQPGVRMLGEYIDHRFAAVCAEDADLQFFRHCKTYFRYDYRFMLSGAFTFSVKALFSKEGGRQRLTGD